MWQRAMTVSGGGGGSADADYFVNVFKSGTSDVHTFTNDLKWVYVCGTKNSSDPHGTYSGSGTVTQMQGDLDSYIDLIENVKANDTYSASYMTVGTNRVMYFMVGKKA